MREEDVVEWLSLFDLAEKIVEADDVSWRMKYKAIFSDAIAFRMREIYEVRYFDPDLDFDDDVRAWFSAQESVVPEIRALREVFSSHRGSNA